MNPLLSAAVSSLSPDQLTAAYADPVTACALYTLLDACSQSILDHLLYVHGPMPFPHIRTRHSTEERGDWNKGLLGLKQLNVLQGRGKDVWVNPVFQGSLIRGISTDARPSCGGQHIEYGTRYDACQDHGTRSDTSIADYEDAVYKIITNSKEAPKRHKPLQQLFTAGKLIDGNQVTRAGFQFLIQPLHLQLWTLLSIHFMTVGGADLVARWRELLSVARWREAGVYSVSVMPVLQDLHISSDGEPTSLHKLLTTNNGASATPNQLQIVVETNFHLYASFTTPLSLAVLSLFTTAKDRLPNLYRGLLTHHSVRSALKRGITADQLCLYLHSHSPPHSPPPTTLQDQIRLWEQDLRRVRTTPNPTSFMYQQFGKQQDFERAVALVREAKLQVLYESGKRRILVVDERGHDLLRAHF